ncbi:MAG TPA: hypothetical protein VME68_10525 [Acidobacteriaceae bacterium]|nr:hypothetical protein [Acidobacteriaceae bacterium]
MESIGLIAAVHQELKPLVRDWERCTALFRGQVGSTEAIAIAAGMGTSAALRGCEAALAAGPIDSLVSIGYAGSVSCGLQAGAAYPIREVIDAATGETFLTQCEKGQRLITLDRVAGPDEKRRLALEHKAVLVDMEAAAVARFAREHNLRFLCFKAVTDGPNDKLPDFNRFVSPKGEWCMTPFVTYLAFHPQYWGAVRRLARNSNAASLDLANLVHRFFAGTQ